jgi:hypothetical protein
MNHRHLASIGAAAVAAVLLAPAYLAAQTSSRAKAEVAANRAPAAKAWAAPRTADGQPDLQGAWSNAVLTPFERSKEFAGKEFFTEKEAEDYAKKVIENGNRDRRGTSAEEDVAGSYNEFWFERGTKVASNLRTSIVVDPPDGRIPALTPEARKAAAAQAAVQRRLPTGPEDFSLQVRCIIWPTVGPPMVPAGYNNNYQIFQTRDYVAILSEMIHDVRIIPLDGRPHIPQGMRQWMGDSRGHWEGSTLVVETTNFTSKRSFRGSDQNLHVTERFTRTAADTILYQFTVDDPTAFTKPWTGEIAMAKTEGAIYEYACHEGNYSVPSMLTSARMEEKAEEAAKKGSK